MTIHRRYEAGLAAIAAIPADESGYSIVAT
jgi:hypothetical protein